MMVFGSKTVTLCPASISRRASSVTGADASQGKLTSMATQTDYDTEEPFRYPLGLPSGSVRALLTAGLS